jgi:DNA polymerase II small subunit
MRDEVLNFLTKYGTLIQPDAVDYIMGKSEPIRFVESVLDNMKETPFMLTVEHLQKVDGITKDAVAQVTKREQIKPTVNFVPDEKPLDDFGVVEVLSPQDKTNCVDRVHPHDLNLISDITGNSTCEGKIGDFKLYFNDRLKTLRRYIREKREMVGFIPISKVAKAETTFKVIGMVSEIRRTQKGNKIISLEDENSTLNILLTRENGLLSDPCVLDEVVGAVCTKFKENRPGRKSNLVMAQNIIRPDIPVNRRPNRTKEPKFVAFASDIHVGSNTFLEDEFGRFLTWLNSKEAELLDYLIIPGDVVDGIGIYPSQEEELKINDIYGQYEELARLCSMIPNRINVVMLPGNHDAVRPAEPQPTFPEDIRSLFSENVTFMGNPCYFSIQGVEILAYHGRSMDDFIKALPQMDYSKAKKIMVEMLKKRHLVPIYGGRTPIAPEHKDYLVINKIPDIFVTGHGHATDLGRYRNITLINASCWQSQTKFQKMHNFNPDPAKVILVNLATGEPQIRDFS